MGAVESGRHEESRAIDIAAEMKARMAVFVCLHAGEREAKRDREDETPFESLAVVLEERMMRPGDRRARGQENQRVQKRQVPRIEGGDSLGRPMPAEDLVSVDVADQFAGLLK